MGSLKNNGKNNIEDIPRYLIITCPCIEDKVRWLLSCCCGDIAISFARILVPEGGPSIWSFDAFATEKFGLEEANRLNRKYIKQVLKAISNWEIQKVIFVSHIDCAFCLGPIDPDSDTSWHYQNLKNSAEELQEIIYSFSDDEDDEDYDTSCSEEITVLISGELCVEEISLFFIIPEEGGYKITKLGDLYI